VDRRLGQELLKAISPLGVEASLKAIEELSAGDVAQRVALSSKLKQLEYEARKAFEQATARRNHSIPGQKRAAPDPERISLSEAARLCGVSHHSIERLVETGLLKREQAAVQ
jgi:hypothetical protein